MTRNLEPESGAELRRWREAKGWTRERAAAYLGISVRTMENWEYGHRKPPALKALEAALRSQVGVRRKKPPRVKAPVPAPKDQR